MNFWKKLFAGMGFVCGFLVFETMSLAYHNSSRRHKNRKGRCRRNSFWDTLTRYMIFAWIYDGVKKSREQVSRRYYRRTGNEFQLSYDSGTRSNPSEPAKAAPKTADAARPKKQRSPSSVLKTTARTASASTADRLKVPVAEAKPPRETAEKAASAAEKPLPDAVPDTENLPAPEPKTPQEVEAERQQMLARLRTELREQVCAIHADVTLPPDRERGSEAAEQQLHILLYQTDVPEAELNAALSDLRTQRRREKAQYQGAPFADVFQVELILSEEDSDRACIVDVGGHRHELCDPVEQYPAGASTAATPLCGTGRRKALRLLQRGTLQHRKRTNDRGAVSGQTGTSRFKDLVLK